MIFWRSSFHVVAAAPAKARSDVLLDVSGFTSRPAQTCHSRANGYREPQRDCGSLLNTIQDL